MNKSFDLLRPIGLLMGFGVSMATLIILSRQVIGTGISGLAIATIQNILAGSLLLILSLARSQILRILGEGGWPLVWYLFISAVLGIALPHWLVFTVTPKIGVGLASVLYLFAPVMTYALSMVAKHDQWDNRRGLGMTLGFMGGVLIVYSSVYTATTGSAISWPWLLIGLLAPMSLAAGNVFRSKFWPTSIPIMALSGFTLLMSGALLAPLSAFSWPETSILLNQAHLLFAMALIAASGYLAFFSLQFSAGAVYVSQSGYVITAIGIAGGIWFYSEVISWPIWAGIMTLCLGVGITTSHLLIRQRISEGV